MLQNWEREFIQIDSIEIQIENSFWIQRYLIWFGYMDLLIFEYSFAHFSVQLLNVFSMFCFKLSLHLTSSCPIFYVFLWVVKYFSCIFNLYSIYLINVIKKCISNLQQQSAWEKYSIASGRVIQFHLNPTCSSVVRIRLVWR